MESAVWSPKQKLGMKFLKLGVDNVIDNLLSADGSNLNLWKQAATSFILENIVF
jgi:hypothetical protein